MSKTEGNIFGILYCVHPIPYFGKTETFDYHFDKMEVE